MASSRIKAPFKPGRVVASVQRDARPGFKEGRLIGEPYGVIAAMTEFIGNRATEVFVVLFLDVRNRLIGYDELGSLGISGVEVHTSGILREALISGAAGGITCHQHPSGDATPSSDDRALWNRLDEAGRIVGFPFVDHLVITHNQYKYFSLREEVR